MLVKGKPLIYYSIKIAQKIIILLFANTVISYINSTISVILGKRLTNIINYKYSELLLEKNNIEKILSKNKNYGKILLDNLESDIRELFYNGQELNSFIKTYLELRNSIKDIKQHAPEKINQVKISENKGVYVSTAIKILL